MRSLSLAVTCMLVLAACEGISGAGGGVVQGVVYTDLNGNGLGDPGEGPLQGVDVQLSGCGATALQTTGADGAFAFGGLPAGSCLVQVSKAGWGFSGSFPSLGYPIPVASSPNLPTSFSVFMASMMDNIPPENCTNELDVITESPMMKAPMTPGQSFTKSWTVLNEGTCTWDEGYHFVFRGGPTPSQGASAMGGPPSTPLGSLVPLPVPPGQQVTIALNQTAPQQTGWYVGAWGVDGPNGDPMTISHGTTIDLMASFYSDIVVKGGTPTPTPAAGQAASISGKAWHDLCALPDGPLPPAPPPGCVSFGGSYEANGILEPAEPGLAGVTIRLGTGACPASGLGTALTGADGSFTFAGLAPGAYCVSVGALIDNNDTVLIPGGWTYPVAHVDPQAVGVSPAAGENLTDINFGWDFQFLPAWSEPTPTPTAASPSGFSPPYFSVPIFYYRGGGCGPKTLDLGLQALDPAVRNIVVFFRLKSPDGQTTSWNQGMAMQSQGGGNFALSLGSESIPGFTSFPRATLQVQFVAEGAAGKILGRTPVYGDVSLEICNR